MRTCAKCECSENRACIEFDGLGQAHACYWVSTDLCSACMFSEHVEPPEFDIGADTAQRIGGRKLKVPELAGMVARPRQHTGIKNPRWKKR